MNAEEFGKMYQKLHHRTFKFLRIKGATVEEAKEFAQAGWAKGFEKLGELRSDGALLPWINEIALNFYRGAWRKGVHISLKSLDLEVMSGGRDLSALLEVDIDLERIMEVTLPAERILLNLMLEEEKRSDIAREHGVTVTAINLRVMRTHQRIRSRLEARAARRRK